MLTCGETMGSQWQPTTACMSSTGSVSQLLVTNGRLMALGNPAIVTLPTASMMAKSGVLAALHSRCTKGTAGEPLMASAEVCSLRCHEPVSGWHRKKPSLSDCPSGVREAIVPALDQATALGKGSARAVRASLPARLTDSSPGSEARRAARGAVFLEA